MTVKFFLPLLLAMAAGMCGVAANAAGPTGLLNDTGQTLCANLANTAMETCSSANTGNASGQPRQDGRFGRDRANPAKAGSGAAGFDFTKICWNGDPEGSGTCTGALVANTGAVATGVLATDWACTKDNLTNLVWSLQSGALATHASTTLPDATNGATRCGLSTGWRLPTRRELLSIVNHDGSAPAIDSSYFPNTVADIYWTSDFYQSDTNNALYVNFNGGTTDSDVTAESFYVRLVRSGP